MSITFLLGTHKDEPLQVLAHHVVHIGIDGLRPDCIFDAPGGALNFKKRMLEKVYDLPALRVRDNIKSSGKPTIFR